jgi:hypothetical protein
MLEISLHIQGKQSKILNHCLQWHGFQTKLGTDPVVQQPSLVMPRKSHGVETPAGGGFCVFTHKNQARIMNKRLQAVALTAIIFVPNFRGKYGNC